MRRGFAFALVPVLGLAGAGLAIGQFAAERPTAAQPVAGPHPWAVQPEHGAFMISIKSFRDDPTNGVNARAQAEELAAEIRETHKAAAYLYEWGGDEKAREEARRAAYRDKLKSEYAPFLALREEMKKKAEATGTEFVDTPVSVRVPKVTYNAEYAVLVGGFKDMDTARKSLDVVKLWAPPKGKDHLLDRAILASPGEKGEKPTAKAGYVSPYSTAFVVPNPSIRKAATDAKPAIDPLLAKLNENEEYSLLKCPKTFTLVVKVMSVPTRTQPKDAEPGVFGKLMGGSKQGNMLDATAQQAHEAAKALRAMKDDKGNSLGLESYVLHARTGSLVTVGGYDSGDDPTLTQTFQKLQAMSFTLKDKDNRPLGVHRMFDQIYPMAIPR